jgi:hypothetical protein
MPKYYKPSVGEEIAYKKVEEVIAPPRERVESEKLVLLIDAKVQVQGSVSGKSYVFSGAGSIVDVDKRDVNDLLQKRQGGRQCCGSGETTGNQVFEFLEK